MQIVAEKCAKYESPLTQEELDMDLSKNELLELGDAKNYKTKLLQNRWAQHRNKWLKEGTPQNVEEDPKNGKQLMPFPHEPKDKIEKHIRKYARKTMRSTTSPYEPFSYYYTVVDIIDQYNDIWIKQEQENEYD